LLFIKFPIFIYSILLYFLHFSPHHFSFFPFYLFHMLAFFHQTLHYLLLYYYYCYHCLSCNNLIFYGFSTVVIIPFFFNPSSLHSLSYHFPYNVFSMFLAKAWLIPFFFTLFISFIIFIIFYFHYLLFIFHPY